MVSKVQYYGFFEKKALSYEDDFEENKIKIDEN